MRHHIFRRGSVHLLVGPSVTRCFKIYVNVVFSTFELIISLGKTRARSSEPKTTKMGGGVGDGGQQRMTHLTAVYLPLFLLAVA